MMKAVITLLSNPDVVRDVEGVQHFECIWSSRDGGTELMKICTVKKTEEINLKEYSVTIQQTT